MKKSTGVLLSFACFLLGLVVGFLLAPIKQGIQVGNNSGNTNIYRTSEGE